MATAERPEPFEFSGGALCLDLANTLGDRPQGGSERLHDLADFVRWCEQAGLIDGGEGDRLRAEAGRRPRAARTAWRRVIELRETIYGVFSAIAAGRGPRPGDLGALNRSLTRALPHQRIEATGAGFVWTWAPPSSGFDHLSWPVVRSAAELLTSADAVRTRECAADTCGWLFIDRSRARRRRWCDMKICGNRAKARRHYRRLKQLG
ncbi:MAG TPA: ABATE domain-containing protein [Candidatus Polarisedimenticolaceae bacterium]|nr:ABATE domain-containing protein [Candidatus Polarisedimenticolaceae bacterium]